ncbi:transglycosylase domain-containing protein [Streptacidiphilus sp. EB129]|uniref:transglycosylase domain-containing protein n=1 Tax=Streptacidiphilus sp. EB129 TaxID=3156262 RepID=UPI0035144B3A
MAAKRSGSPLRNVGLGVRLLGASVLAGTLVAGLCLPAVGALGLSAKSAASDFNNIPDDFTAPPLSEASTIFDANGGVIAKVYSRDRTVVPLSQIAPVMRSALVDIEDNRFYQHGAIDLKGTLRALTKNAGSSGVSQGGSTLTQQYVKNVFVEEAGNDQAKVLEAQRQTFGRKIQELKYAIKLEETLSKDQILTDYLNITFFGEQAYGIEAASERYFSVHASQLSIPQAALLAGMVQSPTGYDPIAFPIAAKTRRDQVLDDMAKYGTITVDQATAAKATPLNLKVSRPQEGCITAKNGEGFFCDYVQHIVLNDPAFGATAQARQALWDQGGLAIHTTIDPKDQAALQKSVTNHVYASDKAATAMTMVQPGTGKILAMGQSRPYGPGDHQTELNYNVDRSMGGGNGFPTGSNFKPVTAAAALENGIGMGQVYASPYQDDYPEMKDCAGETEAQVSGDQNDSVTLHGPFNMPTAMAKSVNTYFVALEAQTGLCNVVRMAQKLGLSNTAVMDGKTGKLVPLKQVQSLTLGVNNLTPLQMANVYATFAADGLYCSPTAITSVMTSSNKSLPVPQANCNQAMSQTTAQSVTSMLKGVVSDGGTANNISIGYDDAGKTGTTDSHLQVWFTGFTKQISASTVVSETKAPLESLSGQTIGGQYVGTAFGSTLAGPIWQDAMAGALSGASNINLDTVPLPAPVAATPAKGTTGGATAGATAGAAGGANGGPGNPTTGGGIIAGLIGGPGGGKGGKTGGH